MPKLMMITKKKEISKIKKTRLKSLILFRNLLNPEGFIKIFTVRIATKMKPKTVIKIRLTKAIKTMLF
jgi:hypothetical protein